MSAVLDGITEVSICTFYTRVLRIFTVLTALRTYEAILTDLKQNIYIYRLNFFFCMLPREISMMALVETRLP